ncbi:hypothetical protein B0H17DRAFT_327079 [Mycena rosella]|uniref:Ricin B lectin domain-containing protein n=1 Tax=Mycena rosella TaxID=1033263 RepID=A0AAD7DVH3_MYCRO|nr:hypothetical protein B0H17DRAFT_327079 [Mycena rosella]
MLVPTLFTVLAAGLATAVPLIPRAATITVSGAGGVLNPTAVAESQKKDTTATFAATGQTIKTSDGQCLSIDATAGDFRENLIPIAVKACDGSQGQQFDFVTKGVHNDETGQTLIVSSLTNGCLNFDDRRAAGDQVILFSCGGRADGVSGTTESQLFPLTSAAELAAPYALAPTNGKGAVCFVNNNGRLSNVACAAGAADQLFTIGSGSGAAPATTAAPAATSAATTSAATTSADTTAAPAATSAAADCVASTVTVTVTVTSAANAATTAVAIVDTTSESSTVAAVTTTTAQAATTTSPSATITVSRAGGVLNPSAVAESQQKDTTATFAATAQQIKTSDGQCLSIDATAGDFRENLIPVAVKACDGSEGQKFDFITKGVHNNEAGQTLIVSSLTNGCLNFDDRRAAGDQVILFSCGGRADGVSGTTDSQLFALNSPADIKAPYVLAPTNGKGAVCFVNNNGRLSNVACDSTKPAANELFTITA